MTTATKVTTLWYAESNKEGVDLNYVQTVNTTTNPEIPGPTHKLGDVVKGNNDSEWLFVQASTTVTQNNVIAIDVNFAANNLTTTIASSNVYSYGIAEFQSTLANAGDYFWALRRASGGATVNVSATAAHGVQLYIATAVAGGGSLTSTASGTAVKNIFVNTSLVAASAFVDVVIPSYITVSV
jgi:hypothetical protein